MSKAEPKRTYESAVINMHAAGIRSRRRQNIEEGEAPAPYQSDETPAVAGLRRKQPAVTPDVIQRLIQILKEL